MPRELSFSSSGEFCFQTTESIPLKSNKIRVRTHFTRIQHGLDRLKIQGNSNAIPVNTSWCGKTWGVGEVIETGSASDRFSIGDRVHGPMRHQDRQTLDPNVLNLLPGIQPKFSTLIGVGTLALTCVRCCGLQYGDRAALYGLGTLGLLALQYMLAGGVREIIAADPLPTRLKTAQRLGAHTLIQAQSDSPGKPVNSIQPINGLDAAIDFTGGPALEEASASIHPGGILVAGALTYPADLMKRVTGQCANRKIQLVSPSEKGPDSRLVETVEYSFTNKHVIVWPIISHVIPFREADRAYRQILDDPDRTIQVILSYD